MPTDSYPAATRLYDGRVIHVQDRHSLRNSATMRWHKDRGTSALVIAMMALLVTAALTAMQLVICDL
jgi:hypothetical protein